MGGVKQNIELDVAVSHISKQVYLETGVGRACLLTPVGSCTSCCRINPHIKTSIVAAVHFNYYVCYDNVILSE